MKKIAKLCYINSILVYLGIIQQIFVIEIHKWIFIYTNSLFQKNAFDFLLKMGPDLTGLLWYTCHRSIYVQVHGEELWPGREPDNTNLYWTIMHFQVKLATENNGFLGSRPLLVLKPIFELENQPNQQQQRLLIWAHLMCFYCCLLSLFLEHV